MEAFLTSTALVALIIASLVACALALAVSLSRLLEDAVRPIAVTLAARLTEIGTLELWAVACEPEPSEPARSDPEGMAAAPLRWRLQFDLRSTEGTQYVNNPVRLRRTDLRLEVDEDGGEEVEHLLLLPALAVLVERPALDAVDEQPACGGAVGMRGPRESVHAAKTRGREGVCQLR